MDRVITCFFAAVSLLISVRGQVFKGDCDFENSYTACGYSQGKEDDLDWEQLNTVEKPSTDPWIPTGSAFMMVNTSDRYAGQRAQLLTPQLKENDTHCILFKYMVSGREGANPGHLNIYIKENNSPMGVPVWNASGTATRTWGQIELAVSTFWPNFYQGMRRKERRKNWSPVEPVTYFIMPLCLRLQRAGEEEEEEEERICSLPPSPVLT